MAKPLMSRLAHMLAKLASFLRYRQFLRSSANLQKTQEAQLRRILVSIEGTESARQLGINRRTQLAQFQEKLPITDYHDWQTLIERQNQDRQAAIISASECNRFQPTSGSTSKIKWIPYTSEFLNELDQAISPWLWSLYSQYSGISRGRHYWSLSWIPSELRKIASGNVNDDLELLPKWKRLFMQAIMAVPDEVSNTESSESSLFATICFLAADKQLTVISVWSPTFALNMLHFMQQHKEAIAQTLISGKWSMFADELEHLEAPHSIEQARTLADLSEDIEAEFLRKLWPDIALISCWDTASSTTFAHELREYFPGAAFEGKGLWATEGVVTFPFKGKYPLSICSHFYEFQDLQDEKIYASWELTKGQVVRPILTTGSGLLRYGMKDKVRVVDFFNQTPCFEFLGRLDGTDMVGEKLSADVAGWIMQNVAAKFDLVKPISLLAVPAVEKRLPYYLLLCESLTSVTSNLSREIAAAVEAELKKHFHYQLARELGQLAMAHCVVSKDAWGLYVSRCQRRGMVEGNIKVESLVQWDSILPAQFAHPEQPFESTHSAASIPLPKAKEKIRVSQ